MSQWNNLFYRKKLIFNYFSTCLHTALYVTRSGRSVPKNHFKFETRILCELLTKIKIFSQSLRNRKIIFCHVDFREIEHVPTTISKLWFSSEFWSFFRFSWLNWTKKSTYRLESLNTHNKFLKPPYYKLLNSSGICESLSSIMVSALSWWSLAGF